MHHSPVPRNKAKQLYIKKSEPVRVHWDGAVPEGRDSMSTHTAHRQVRRQATKASVEGKGQKEPRLDLGNKKQKTRMENQGIGRDGMGWEGVLERTLSWQQLWKIKVQNEKVFSEQPVIKYQTS